MINIAFPAVILTIIPTMDINIDALIPFLTYWLLVPITWTLSMLIAKKLAWPSDIRCAMFVLCVCGNTGFLGIPMVKALLGQESLGYALFYDQLGSFLGVSTIVTIAIAFQQTSNETINIKTLATKIICFPPFAVLIVSLLLPAKLITGSIHNVLEILGHLIVPATMLAIGLQFSIKISKDYYIPLGMILFVKMLLLPCIALVALRIIQVDPLITTTTVFQAAAAPMVTAAVLLMAARIAVPLVTSVLGLGTFLSFILLPLWVYLLS